MGKLSLSKYSKATSGCFIDVKNSSSRWPLFPIGNAVQTGSGDLTPTNHDLSKMKLRKFCLRVSIPPFYGQGLPLQQLVWGSLITNLTCWIVSLGWAKCSISVSFPVPKPSSACLIPLLRVGSNVAFNLQKEGSFLACLQLHSFLPLYLGVQSLMGLELVPCAWPNHNGTVFSWCILFPKGKRYVRRAYSSVSFFLS